MSVNPFVLEKKRESQLDVLNTFGHSEKQAFMYACTDTYFKETSITMLLADHNLLITKFKITGMYLSYLQSMALSGRVHFGQFVMDLN